jgi:hypothetical protein
VRLRIHAGAVTSSGVDGADAAVGRDALAHACQRAVRRDLAVERPREVVDSGRTSSLVTR